MLLWPFVRLQRRPTILNKTPVSMLCSLLISRFLICDSSVVRSKWGILESYWNPRLPLRDHTVVYIKIIITISYDLPVNLLIFASSMLRVPWTVAATCTPPSPCTKRWKRASTFNCWKKTLTSKNLHNPNVRVRFSKGTHTHRQSKACQRKYQQKINKKRPPQQFQDPKNLKTLGSTRPAQRLAKAPGWLIIVEVSACLRGILYNYNLNVN